jgi:hypothetical protein
MTILPLILMAVIFGAVLLVGYRMTERRRTPRAAVVGVDLFTKTFVELVPSFDKPVTAAVVWIAVSLIVSVVAPALHAKGAYVLQPTQAITAFSYCIVFPCLLGSYVYLVMSLSYFETRNLRRLRPTEKKNRRLFPWLTTKGLVWQLLLLAVALGLQYFAILDEIEQPGPCSPWVEPTRFDFNLDKCAIGKEGFVPAAGLSVVGVLHYCLRGIDAFMALGLVSVLTAAWWRRKELFARHKLIDFAFPGLGPSSAIGHVGTSLVLCVVFGSLVTALSGFALWSQSHHLDLPTKVRLFAESTWAFWALAMMATTVFTAALVVWLHERMISELLRLQNSRLARYASLGAYGSYRAADLADAKLHSDYVGHKLDVRSQMEAIFRNAKTWPLPRGSGPAVILAMSGQAINVGMAFYTILVLRPHPH